jgi:ferrous iron transport protein A
VLLSDLPRYAQAIVQSVEPTTADDPIAQRLSALGFVRGEQVRLITVGPFGGDPLLVQVGFTRFALRRSEAARVHVLLEPLT